MARSILFELEHATALAYEACRSHAYTTLGEERPTWQELSPAEQLPILQGAQDLAGWATATEPRLVRIHEQWLLKKQEEGWDFAERLNQDDKLSPYMAEWSHLPPDHRMMDVLFASIVLAFANQQVY